MSTSQQTVLDAFQRKFCKVPFTDNQRAQFLWLWRRIERTLNDDYRRAERSREAKRATEETPQDDRGGSTDNVPAIAG